MRKPVPTARANLSMSMIPVALVSLLHITLDTAPISRSSFIASTHEHVATSVHCDTFTPNLDLPVASMAGTHTLLSPLYQYSVLCSPGSSPAVSFTPSPYVSTSTDISNQLYSPRSIYHVLGEVGPCVISMPLRIKADVMRDCVPSRSRNVIVLDNRPLRHTDIVSVGMSSPTRPISLPLSSFFATA